MALTLRVICESAIEGCSWYKGGGDVTARNHGSFLLLPASCHDDLKILCSTLCKSTNDEQQRTCAQRTT